jgi:hypothetical protein
VHHVMRVPKTWKLQKHLLLFFLLVTAIVVATLLYRRRQKMERFQAPPALPRRTTPVGGGATSRTITPPTAAASSPQATTASAPALRRPPLMYDVGFASFAGMDLREEPDTTSSPEACKQLCVETDNCVASQYTLGATQKNCVMKSTLTRNLRQDLTKFLSVKAA